MQPHVIIYLPLPTDKWFGWALKIAALIEAGIAVSLYTRYWVPEQLVSCFSQFTDSNRRPPYRRMFRVKYLPPMNSPVVISADKLSDTFFHWSEIGLFYPEVIEEEIQIAKKNIPRSLYCDYILTQDKAWCRPILKYLNNQKIRYADE